MGSTVWPWLLFLAIIFGMLALDLGLFHRRAHAVSTREAAAWTAVWITLAFLFNAGIYVWKGPEPALQFLTGYLLEKALSVDNIFVFILIFGYFAVPAAYQHRILFWGVLGAFVMRGVFIALGSYLISHFHWVIYVFGGFLVLTGLRIALRRDEAIDPADSGVIRLVSRFVPIATRYHGERFWIREGTRWVATPLLLVLILVETTDLVFAVDSIPAIFAVTTDPFIVFTSNVFAILGLRALYFLLAEGVRKLVYLQYGLGLILVFVGTKMLVTDLYRIPVVLSLGVVATVLFGTVVASLKWPPPPAAEPEWPELPRAEVVTPPKP